MTGGHCWDLETTQHGHCWGIANRWVPYWVVDLTVANRPSPPLCLNQTRGLQTEWNQAAQVQLIYSRRSEKWNKALRSGRLNIQYMCNISQYPSCLRNPTHLWVSGDLRAWLHQGHIVWFQGWAAPHTHTWGISHTLAVLMHCCLWLSQSV